MADAYIKHLSPSPTPSDIEEIHREFTDTFLEGFTSRDAELVGRSDAAEHGFQAGQEFRHKVKAAEIRQIMEDFGYLATEADGTWAVDPNVSGFSPSNARDQRWRVDEFRDTIYILPKVGVRYDRPAVCHVSGFLSPQGKYGYLGDYGYDHEFYATKVVYIKSGDQHPLSPDGQQAK